MDLKVFYQKLRKIEQEILDPHVLVVSFETPDGGIAGQISEVSRIVAARLILEARARLATAEEAAQYKASVEEARQAAHQRALSERVQVNLISDADLRALKTATRQDKRLSQ